MLAAYGNGDALLGSIMTGKIRDRLSRFLIMNIEGGKKYA
jgi:hypothetical protein